MIDKTKLQLAIFDLQHVLNVKGNVSLGHGLRAIRNVVVILKPETINDKVYSKNNISEIIGRKIKGSETPYSIVPELLTAARKFLILFLCLVAAGCSQNKLETPDCPDSNKAAETVNEPGLSPVVSDDGKFTYLRFGPGQEIPNITALRIDGGERHVDFTVNENRTATVFGIYPTIVLRAGKRVACLRNNGYDPRSPQPAGS